MNIPLDYSKNICQQMKDWQNKYVTNQTNMGIPYYDALNKSVEEITKYVDSNWENKTFVDKWANDFIEMIKDDPQIFDELWESAKPSSKQEMDETLDKFNQGLITKQEMEKTLKFHSIIYEE